MSTAATFPDEIWRAIEALVWACDNGRTDQYDTARAHLNALILAAIGKPSAAVIPEGWRMVKSEPTREMIDVGNSFGGGTLTIQGYRDMCAASPTPPALTLADIAALITSVETEKSIAQSLIWTTSSTTTDVRTALRVAAEAVLKMGEGR